MPILRAVNGERRGSTVRAAWSVSQAEREAARTAYTQLRTFADGTGALTLAQVTTAVRQAADVLARLIRALYS